MSVSSEERILFIISKYSGLRGYFLKSYSGECFLAVYETCHTIQFIPLDGLSSTWELNDNSLVSNAPLKPNCVDTIREIASGGG